MNWNLENSVAKIKGSIKQSHKNHENVTKVHYSWQVFSHEGLQSAEARHKFSPDVDL